MFMFVFISFEIVFTFHLLFIYVSILYFPCGGVNTSFDYYKLCWSVVDGGGGVVGLKSLLGHCKNTLETSANA